MQFTRWIGLVALVSVSCRAPGGTELPESVRSEGPLETQLGPDSRPVSASERPPATPEASASSLIATSMPRLLPKTGAEDLCFVANIDVKATITPGSPCFGDDFVLKVSAIPPGERLDVWLMPVTTGGKSLTLPHPRLTGFYLGTLTVSEHGNGEVVAKLKYAFPPAVSPPGMSEIWLALNPTTQGIPILPSVVRFRCGA